MPSHGRNASAWLTPSWLRSAQKAKARRQEPKILLAAVGLGPSRQAPSRLAPCKRQQPQSHDNETWHRPACMALDVCVLVGAASTPRQTSSYLLVMPWVRSGGGPQGVPAAAPEFGRPNIGPEGPDVDWTLLVWGQLKVPSVERRLLGIVQRRPSCRSAGVGPEKALKAWSWATFPVCVRRRICLRNRLSRSDLRRTGSGPRASAPEADSAPEDRKAAPKPGSLGLRSRAPGNAPPTAGLLFIRYRRWPKFVRPMLARASPNQIPACGPPGGGAQDMPIPPRLWSSLQRRCAT